MLLGTLQSASVDARDVTLKFSTPEGITKAWDKGDVDAAWCSGGCMGHLV
jgi:ABC-type taurine transport system substrate-binding protein